MFTPSRCSKNSINSSYKFTSAWNHFDFHDSDIKPSENVSFGDYFLEAHTLKQPRRMPHCDVYTKITLHVISSARNFPVDIHSHQLTNINISSVCLFIRLQLAHRADKRTEWWSHSSRLKTSWFTLFFWLMAKGAVFSVWIWRDVETNLDCWKSAERLQNRKCWQPVPLQLVASIRSHPTLFYILETQCQSMSLFSVMSRMQGIKYG